jgi:subtilisin family serine protease
VARFVVSHRMAGKRSQAERDASFAAWHDAQAHVRKFADIVHRNNPLAGRRGVLFIDSDPREINAKRRDAHADLIVEPQVERTTARYLPFRALGLQRVNADSGATGIGATLDLTVKSAAGPVSGVAVNVAMSNARTGASTVLTTNTDANGLAAFTYDASVWVPATAIVHPHGGVWSWTQPYPKDGMTIQLADLPRSGPMGWWHSLLGMTKYTEQRGSGIRVGVVDTGAGPHPYLAQVQAAGAFLNGALSDAAGATNDVADHGTHVSGIIAARPAAGSQDFGGIAAGADVFVARVYPGGGPAGDEGTANNGDIAAAIDALSSAHQVDLLNLSLGGAQPSEIEMDAVSAAIEAGVLLICAAGNGNGAPVIYPAAYPGAVAVSAIGLNGTYPAGSVDALSMPQQADHFAANGIYAASFNNIGPAVVCTGPGVAIISTVPSADGQPAYGAMSGTSMASPVVCASLAAVLSEDAQYRKLPRDASRAQYAWTVLARGLRPLGLNSQYQGYGMASTAP